MRKIFLIIVWIVGLSNGLFFADILINFILGNSKSMFSGATTEQTQALLSIVMLVLISFMLYLYTNVLTSKKDVSIL